MEKVFLYGAISRGNAGRLYVGGWAMDGEPARLEVRRSRGRLECGRLRAPDRTELRPPLHVPMVFMAGLAFLTLGARKRTDRTFGEIAIFLLAMGN